MMQNGYNLTRFKINQTREMVWKVFAPHLQEKFKIKGSVLDVGCGYGSFINNIICEEKYATDINEHMKQYLNKDVIFKSGSTRDIRSNFVSKKFDFIFTSNLLEHLSREDLNILFSDFKYMLKENASLIVFMPNYRFATSEYFDDYTHLTPISDRSLVDWLASYNFETRFCHPGYMPYSVKDSRLPICPTLIKLWLISPFKPGGKQMLVQAFNKN